MPLRRPSSASLPAAAADAEAPPIDPVALVGRLRSPRTDDAMDAFETLFRTYVPGLLDFAWRLLHSRDDAEEVVQAVMATIWERRAALTILGPLDRYLYLAVRNRIRNRLAHQVVERRWREHATPTHDERAALEPADHPATNLERAEYYAALERALATLPERRRAVCTLRWGEHLSYAQIAHRLGIAEKTVENHLALALAQLREQLKAIMLP